MLSSADLRVAGFHPPASLARVDASPSQSRPRGARRVRDVTTPALTYYKAGPLCPGPLAAPGALLQPPPASLGSDFERGQALCHWQGTGERPSRPGPRAGWVSPAPHSTRGEECRARPRAALQDLQLRPGGCVTSGKRWRKEQGRSTSTGDRDGRGGQAARAMTQLRACARFLAAVRALGEALGAEPWCVATGRLAL